MRRALLLGALLLTAVADPAPAAAAPGDLRDWFLTLEAVTGGRDRWNVFGRPGLPPAPVADTGAGAGFHVGRRCGDRFLLGLQFLITGHDLDGVPERLYDGELLITGTVLFRERAALQPFVRGGFGGGGVAVESPGGGHTVAVGTAVVAGGGVRWRLGGRVSLELEAVATFTNLLEARDETDEGAVEEDWDVRTSQAGWRTGAGVAFWF